MLKILNLAMSLFCIAIMLLSCSSSPTISPNYKDSPTPKPSLQVQSTKTYTAEVKTTPSPAITRTGKAPLMSATPSKTPLSSITPQKLQSTPTDIPEERRYSYSSPDGDWVVHEALGDTPNAQVISKDGKTKFVISYNDVEPIYGTQFNWVDFRQDAVYFGIGPVNYEIQILQRFPPSYSLYRLDLTNGMISNTLEVKMKRFPVYTYFDLSTDETQLVYSRWYENTIVIRDLGNLSEKTLPLPTDYLIAGAFSWSPEDDTIVFTMWKDDYELSTDFAVAKIDLNTLSISILLQDNETKYFLVAVKWLDEQNVILEDRRYGNYWEMNIVSGKLKPYTPATISP